MNDAQNHQNNPQAPQGGPQPGPAAQQPSAGPQGYGPAQYQGYQEPQANGYGYPPAPGNGPPPWAQHGGYPAGYHPGGYQDRYQGGCGHPPAPGNNPSWAHQDHHRGGHPAYYGPQTQTQGYYPPGHGAYPAYHPGYHPGYASAQAAAAYAHDSGLSSFFNFRDERFIKGAITGAALTFLLTNDSVQKNAIKSVVKLWTLFQGGVEEIKERFKDAEAEIKTETQPSNP